MSEGRPRHVSTREFTHGRTRSIDSLRGLAVFLMLAYHFLVWLMVPAARGAFYRVVQVLATFFAPSLFFIITGLTLTLSVVHRQAEGDSNWAIGQHVVQRYGGLMLIGFTLNVVLWGPRSLWIWDVLEVIGLCNVLAFLVMLAQSELVLFAVALAGAGSYYLVRMIEIPALLDPVLHNALRGPFAVGPFLFFTLMGVLFGRRLVDMVRSGRTVRVCPVCVQGGGALLVLSLLMKISGLSITRYPISLSYLVFASGVALLLLSAFFWWQDVKGKRAILLAPMMVYGRYALAIYIGHYLVYRLGSVLGLLGGLQLASAVLVSGALFAGILGFVVYVKPSIWGQVRAGPEKDVNL